MADDALSDEDKALFRNHMREVRPLVQQNKIKSEQISTPPERSPRKYPIKSSPPQPVIALSNYIQDEVTSDTVLSWCRNPLPHARMNAFKKGQLRWEACLDLHGLRSDEAGEKLGSFILSQARKGRRCLLVVHGRGSYQGEAPVLKNLINRWLPQLNEVLAFHTAHPKDGGLGAVYVLLKRIIEK